MFLPRSIRQITTGWQHAILVCLLVCSVGLSAFGIPVPRFLPKDTTQPFPCQSRRCGCSDAASCWRSCCCHTNEQKVAWARRMNVTPPKFVVVAAARETQQRNSCCDSQASSKRNAGTNSCCSSKTSSSQLAEKSAKPRSSSVAQRTTMRIDLIRIEEARNCQGQIDQWMRSQCVVCVGQRPQFRLTMDVVEWLSDFCESAKSPSLQPDVPPPKLNGVLL